MERVLLTLEQAADAIEVRSGELKTKAVQGEIPCVMHGDRFMFQRDDIDLWYSRHIIHGDYKASKPAESPGARHGRRAFPALSVICPRQCVTCALPGTSRASIIKMLTDLADKSGFLYDPRDLRDEITRREECDSTNIGGGIAIPHTMVRDEGYFSQTFICLARLARPTYFNSAPDGSMTEFLILSCSADSDEHVSILGRISMICRMTDFMDNVRAATCDEDIYEALVNAEAAILKGTARYNEATK